MPAPAEMPPRRSPLRAGSRPPLQDNELERQAAVRQFAVTSWLGPLPGAMVALGYLARGARLAAAETMVALVILEISRQWVLRRPDVARVTAGLHVWVGTVLVATVAASLSTGLDQSILLWFLCMLPFVGSQRNGLRPGLVWLAAVLAGLGLILAVRTFGDVAQEWVPTPGDRIAMIVVVSVMAALNGVQNFEQIYDRVIDMRAQADELAAARDVALAASTAKSNFLATMSHEMRTPLHGLTVALDLLAQDELSPEARRRLSTALACARDARGVIDDILDFSRFEALDVEPDDVAFSLRALVTQAVDMVRADAEQRGLTVEERCAPDMPDLVVGDADKVRRVLVNLVGNAVKFTTEGGVVVEVGPAVVGLADAPGGAAPTADVRFVVTDTGIGIASDALARIFDVFEQADSSTTRRFGGTGLGLAISRHLVHHLGGEIDVTSRPGEGSTFSFSVPLPAAPADAAPAILAPLPVPPSPVPAPTGPVAGMSADGSGPLVLVVDDNPLNAALAAELLASLGCRSITAPDGPSALAAVQQHPDLDVVVLDSHLPGMHGSEVAARIRAMPDRHGLRLVGLTADVSTGNLEASVRAGMDRVIGKPAGVAQFRSVLRDLGVLAVEFDTAPLVQARAMLLEAPTPDLAREVVALLEPCYQQAVAMVEQLRDDPERAERFRRAHGDLVGSLVYAIEFAHREPMTGAHCRQALQFLDRAIAWEDRPD